MLLEADLPGPSLPSAVMHGTKDIYVLDVCGCRFERRDVLPCPALNMYVSSDQGQRLTCPEHACRDSLTAQIMHMTTLLPVNLSAILSCLVCPNAACRQPLSRNVLCNLACTEDVAQVDSSICAAALREAAFQARRLREALQVCLLRNSPSTIHAACIVSAGSATAE